MDAAAFNEYLEKRYYDQLKYYEFSSDKNQKRYKNFQWILIILSTLTTILAALPKIENFNLQYVIVVTAALVTILTSGLKTFQYQELWVNYRSTIEQLKPEIYYYNFNVGEYGQQGVDKKSLFVSRVEKILNKEHDGWPAVKKLEDKSGQQETNELQNKLEKLLREKFDAQKNNQPEVPADANQPDKPVDGNQGDESSDTKQTENTEEPNADEVNTGTPETDPNGEDSNKEKVNAGDVTS